MDKELVTVILSVTASFVSIATLLVALSQVKIASAKTRLDLYNKRFNVYATALDYYKAAWGDSEQPVKIVAANFIKAYRESQFLFKASDGVYDTLTKIKDAGAAATGLEKLIAEIDADIAGDRRVAGQFREKRMEKLNEFEQALMTLEQQLGAYIRFEHASGWHPFK